MSFGITLKKLRQDNNLTQEELAKKIDTSRSNIANYENDKNMPSVDILEKLSKILNCSTDYLLGKSKVKNIDDLESRKLEELKKQLQTKNISSSQTNELMNYLSNNSNKLTYEFENFLNSLNPEVKDFIIHFNYNSSLKMLQYVNKSISKIPILGTVKAGYDWLAEENVIGYITDENTVKGYEKNINEYYALEIIGDSMLPLLSEGDLVIVHDQYDVESGQTAVVLINGEEATVKKLIKTSEGIELHAMNPYYPIRKFTFEDMKNIPVKIIGRVKEAKIKGAFE